MHNYIVHTYNSAFTPRAGFGKIADAIRFARSQRADYGGPVRIDAGTGEILIEMRDSGCLMVCCANKIGAAPTFDDAHAAAYLEGLDA